MIRSLLRYQYRWLQSTFVKHCLLSFWFSKERQAQGVRTPPSQLNLSMQLAHVPEQRQRRVWFHAASVGELESLWPLVIASAKKGDELILTVFSESARGALEKLKQELQSVSQKVLSTGFSPWEGEWSSALAQFQPTLFVTAKYEAWPDLWISLEEQGIPLAIVSAQFRKSLQVAKLFCRVLGKGEPRMFLFPCLESDISPLKKAFPDAQIECVGEPRWERVFARSQQGNSRARQIIEKAKEFKRPWGVIGSAWIEDLQFLKPILNSFKGTLWVVPHQIDSKNVAQMESFLRESSLSPLCTTYYTHTHTPHTETHKDSQRTCLIVNEMGFLAELYAVADWAFIGGGFGAGIHSTIEPAIQGIPIGAGPCGAEKFTEVSELTHSGQLHVLQTPSDLREWFQSLSEVSHTQKARWVSEAQFRLGATEKILSAIARNT